MLDSATRLARIRHHIRELSYRTQGPHLGSSLSVVEILDAVVESSDLRPATASFELRDRIVFSKGHAAMAYYATLHEWGLLPRAVLDEYGKNGSRLWGHVSRHADFPAIDYSTGSLGHGLGLAAGHALGYRLRGVSHRVFCILSDGECNEGGIWESALFAGHHRLQNLTVLIDYNGLQGLGACHEVLDLEPFGSKWKAFGFDVEEGDGHDGDWIRAGLKKAADRPKVILCRTIKGKGIPGVENTVASHYFPANQEQV